MSRPSWGQLAGIGVVASAVALSIRHARRVLGARRRLRELLDAAAGDMDARIVITGATSGVGLELAQQFARHPSVSLLLGCRDTARAKRLFGGCSRTTVASVDLQDFDSVQSFTEQVHEFLAAGEAEGLRVLINNAGVMKPPGDAVAGLDRTWRTNFLGPFLLTELLGRFRSARDATVRVVHVSSRLERRSQLDDELLEAVGRNANVGPHAYGDSKRALLLWTSVRAQSLALKKNLYVHAATPGMVDTQLGRYSVKPWLWPLTKPLRVLLLRPAAVGALAVAAAGLRPKASACFGRYLDGETELEDLVMERMGDKQLALKISAWATKATALEQRAEGYSK